MEGKGGKKKRSKEGRRKGKMKKEGRRKGEKVRRVSFV